MVALDQKVFLTAEVAKILGLPEWRVIKFVESKEYEIKPSVSNAAGSGTRRLYNIEDVCQLALAIRLLETGLRSKAIGKVIRELRQKVKLRSFLHFDESGQPGPYLAIFRTPLTGRPLQQKRPLRAAFVESPDEAVHLLTKRIGDDLVLVSLGSWFSRVKKNLQESEKAK